MAAIVSVVVFALAGVLLSFANHQSSASNNDRQRQLSIDGAMAGLVVADSALTKGGAYADSGVLKPFVGGGAEYKVTVANDPSVASGLGRIVTAVAYSPSFAGAKATRTVKQAVVLDPIGGGFTYAVYTTGNLITGSAINGGGGMYTKGQVQLSANGMVYSGDVNTTANITTGTNQTINGALRSGGGVTINGSTIVNGDVVGGSITIATGGKINGTAKASGDVTGAPGPGGNTNCSNPQVPGTCIRYTTPVPAVTFQNNPSPFFTWLPANYPLGFTTLTGPAFVTATNKVNAQGVFNINNNNIIFPSDGELWLTGDMTMYSAAGTVTLPPKVINKSGGPVQFNVIAPSGAITANNLKIDPTVTTLMFTSGEVHINETASTTGDRPITGVIYSTGAVTLGANSSLTFAPVTAPGFNLPPPPPGTPQTFAIHSISTREINSSP
jgi:cytoskeletal protein CcmA (bactofilin family)